MGAPRSTGGFQVHRNDIDALADYVDKITPIGGPNTTVTDSPTGRGRVIEARGGPAGSAAAPADFSLYDASSNHADAGGLWVGVRFGIINCYRTAPDLLPWPSDFNAGNAYKYEFAVTTGGVAWVQCHNDTSGAYNQVNAISMGSGASQPANDDTSGYLSVGAWSVDGSGKLAILSGAGRNGIGNQMYNFCGNSHFWAPL